MSYIGTEPKDIRSFGRTKFDYTATQGQTAFTGADDDGKVLAFTVGQIEVYVNGILMDDSDFTTTGTGTVTLATAANLNDVINIVSFETNIPDSNYVPATGGTFSGDVDFGANKITYANIYAQLSDLPSASTYHGMFAHVHATGLAYYAHAGAWIPVANLTGATFTGDVTFADGADIITATAGTSNFRAGVNAGNSIASGGNYNTVVGDEAGTAISTGSDNVAVGTSALDVTTTGHQNTAVGRDALGANTTASNNTAVGHQAGLANSTGHSNTYIGRQAGLNNTTNNFSTYLGYVAGESTTGEKNTFLGQGAGSSVTTGAKNTILGRYNGNQGSHDIRTSDNQIVLSDGDGNPRLFFHSFWQTDGHAFATIRTTVQLNNASHTDITVPHGVYIMQLRMIVAGAANISSTYTTASWYHSSVAYMDVIQLGDDGGGLSAQTATASSGNMKVRVVNNTGYSGHDLQIAFFRMI